MRPGACCRCGSELVPPGPFDSDWRCSVHGPVSVLRALEHVGPEAVRYASRGAAVPVWVPRPMPTGWHHAGIALVGDPRRRDDAAYLAVVNAFAVPHPLGGEAEVLLVAEQPGLGVGASYAGLPGARNAPTVEVSDWLTGESHARVVADGRPTALWSLPAAPDRCAYLGEASGVWLWVIGFPPEAGWLLLDQPQFVDARSAPDAVLEAGPLSHRLNLRTPP